RVALLLVVFLLVALHRAHVIDLDARVRAVAAVRVQPRAERAVEHGLGLLDRHLARGVLLQREADAAVAPVERRAAVIWLGRHAGLPGDVLRGTVRRAAVRVRGGRRQRDQAA